MPAKKKKTTKKKPDGRGRPKGPSPANKAKLENFLAVLAETGHVGFAAGEAKIPITTLYRHKRQNKKFREQWDESIDCAVETILEPEAVRRGVSGWEEPLSYQGRWTGDYVRKYSDTLLIFLLKGAKPEKYRERFDYTGKQTVTQEATICYYPAKDPEPK